MGGTLNNIMLVSDFKFNIDYVVYRAHNRLFA